MKEIGTRLRKIRESQDKIQYAVAVEAGITQSAYARIESGQRIPRLKTLESIAKSLNVPLSQLLPTTGSWMGRTTLIGVVIRKVKYACLKWRFNIVVKQVSK